MRISACWIKIDNDMLLTIGCSAFCHRILSKEVFCRSIVNVDWLVGNLEVMLCYATQLLVAFHIVRLRSLFAEKIGIYTIASSQVNQYILLLA